MAAYTVQGLVKASSGHWVIWTALGSYAIKDFGVVGEGMLDFTTGIEADSPAEAIAIFVDTYFPMSDDGPEVFDEVVIRDVG
jgi:hypothetical protein